MGIKKLDKLGYHFNGFEIVFISLLSLNLNKLKS